MAGQSFPDYTLHAIVGKPLLRSGEKIEGIELKGEYVCDETTNIRSMLDLSYPLKEGIVDDWDNMEKVWKYAFEKKMNITDYGEHNILLTEAAENPTKNRVKMAEIMLESFGYKGISFQIQALLSLFCEGKKTGLVMDSGDGVSHTIPVFEGHLMKEAIQRLNVAGRHVTEYMIKVLLMRGYAFNSSADYETVRDIKENLCYVSYDLERDRLLARETCAVDQEYQLPNKEVIRIGRERFEGPECLFNPSLLDIESPGIPDMIFETIQKSAIDTRKALYNNILITGGSTMFPGFPTRVEKDLKARFKQDVMKGKDYESGIKINILDNFRRRFAVFAGASIIATSG